MGLFQRPKPVLTAAAIFFGTALSLALMFLRGSQGDSWTDIMAVTSPFIFLCACVLVLFRPTLGYALGAIAGVVALPWFVLTERPGFPSAWTYLNAPDDFGISPKPFAILKLLSVALISFALTCLVLRLLPSRFTHRTWPAIAVAFLVLAVWFQHSASPWMLPAIADAVTPELRILHVEKDGLQFRETSVVSMRNGRFWVSHNDRRLFQYQFATRSADGVLPEPILERANLLAQSTMLRNMRTPRPVPLRAWNAEGWYVASDAGALLAFTTEYGTKPPPEVKDVFEQIARLQPTQPSSTFQDVCLGFCYDPVAGLGLIYSNQRCHEMSDGTVKCL